jgi:hypothetical protein
MNETMNEPTLTERLIETEKLLLEAKTELQRMFNTSMSCCDMWLHTATRHRSDCIAGRIDDYFDRVSS